MDEIRNRKIRSDALKSMRTRVNAESLEDLEASIADHRRLIERCRMIKENLVHNPGWEAITQDIKNELEDAEARLDEFEGLSDKGRDYLLATRQILRRFLDRFDQLDKIIELTAEQMNEQQATLNEKRQRIRVSQG